MNDIRVFTAKNGRFAIFDETAWQSVRNLPLGISEKGYCVFSVTIDGQQTTKQLSRLLVGAESNVQVDHRNGYPLDNTFRNLREATPSQNCCNKSKKRGCTSKYKGVVRRINGKFHARIGASRDGRVNLGTFDSEIEAAKAYNAAAIQRYGEFAKLNNIGEEKESQ